MSPPFIEITVATSMNDLDNTLDHSGALFLFECQLVLSKVSDSEKQLSAEKHAHSML